MASKPSSIWIIDASSSAAPVTTKRGVTITSPKYAKGLEADHVIVCNLPETFDHAGSAAFYVAVTRARVGLHILVSAADKKRLQELLKSKMGASVTLTGAQQDVLAHLRSAYVGPEGGPDEIVFNGRRTCSTPSACCSRLSRTWRQRPRGSPEPTQRPTRTTRSTPTSSRVRSRIATLASRSPRTGARRPWRSRS